MVAGRGYRSTMSRVVLMCGPAGSGKSTVARRMEAEGLVRLSLDQEAWVRGSRAMPLPDETRTEIEHDLHERLTELVRKGRDVVVDLSFWSRAMRDDWRRLLAGLGVVPEIVLVTTDRPTALARVRARSGLHADDFRLDDELAARYFDHFEPPTADEGPLTVIET